MSSARGLICRILNIIPALGLILEKEYYKNILVVENGAHRLRLKSANDSTVLRHQKCHRTFRSPAPLESKLLVNLKILNLLIKI